MYIYMYTYIYIHAYQHSIKEVKASREYVHDDVTWHPMM